MKVLRLCVDNTGVVSAARSFTSASRPMMSELRRLKSVLDARGLQIRPEWLPSAANRFADMLSRRFPAGDVGVSKMLVRSVLDGLSLEAPMRFPRTLGSHPVYARRHAFEDLQRHWNPHEIQVLFPPPDLAMATVRRLRLSHAPAVLLLPDWPQQAWFQEALQLSTASYRAAGTGSAVLTGHRVINPGWGVRVFIMQRLALPESSRYLNLRYERPH